MRSFLLIILFFYFLSFDAMAAVVTKTIGTTSRDYSTVTAWVADFNDDGIYSNGDTAIGEVYDDSDFDETIDINNARDIGGVGGVLAEVRLTVPVSERHDGTAGTGARVLASATRRVLLGGSTAPTLTIIEWLDHNNNGTTGTLSGDDGIWRTGTARAYVVRNNIIHNWLGGFQGTALARFDGRGPTNRIHNNIFYRRHWSSSNTNSTRGILIDSLFCDSTIHVSNNTVHNIKRDGTGAFARGISTETNCNKVHVRNNHVTDVGGTGTGTHAGYSLGSNIVRNNNISEDTTADGTGSLTEVDPSGEFVSTTVGSEDLKLKSGAEAIEAGADLSAVGSGIEIDIDGDDRTGLTWDIGADQFIGVAPPGRRRIMKLL